MWQFSIAGPLYILQLPVSEIGIAGLIYCSLQCDSLVQRDCFTAAYSEADWYSGTALLYAAYRVAVWYSGTALCSAAYIVAVWYSGTAVLQFTVWQFGIAGPLYVLQLTVWQFGIAGRICCSLQCGSLV